MNRAICVEKLRMTSIGFVNYSYVLFDQETKAAFIVDPAWNLQQVLNVVERLGANLKGILLTHSHFDHTNLVDDLIRMFQNIAVYMSAVEAGYYNFHCRNLVLLNANDTIRLGRKVIRCILAPGHTKGSLLYLVEGHLFTGDTIFIEGCGICSSLGGSSEEMYHTVQMVRRLPEHLIVWPGHAFGNQPGSPLKMLHAENIYFQIEDQETFVTFSNRRKNSKIFDFR